MIPVTVNKKYSTNDYVVPLDIDISKAGELFEKHYKHRKQVFLNSFDMTDDVLSIVPTYLHEYLTVDKVWIGYFHKQRRSKQYIPIHLDNHSDNVKYPCSINIPILGCNERITTSFWEPVDEVVGEKKPKSEAYSSGELEHAFEFALTDTPVLFNNQKWHSVFNPMPQTHERAIMIFKFNNKEISWDFFRELTSSIQLV